MVDAFGMGPLTVPFVLNMLQRSSRAQTAAVYWNPMPTFDISQVTAAITSGNIDSLKGEVENEWLECKGQPYPVHAEHGKRELSKDVSSLANRSGGLILIGLRTEKSATHFGDEIVETRPLDRSLVDPDQYLKVLREWIFPDLEGIQVTWHKSDAAKGIFVIEIPPQPDEKKPFLIFRTVDLKKNVEILFGYAQRKKENSEPMTIEQIHSLLRMGMGYERIMHQRFAAIESLLEIILSGQAQIQPAPLTVAKSESAAPTLDDLLPVALQEARRAAGIRDTKFMFLIAAPQPFVEIEGIFGTEKTGIRHLLENPPSLRLGGWDLETGTSSQIIKGKLVRTLIHERKVLELYKNGVALFSARADQEFLCWGSEDGRINPVALIETVLNFLHFYRDVIPYMKPQPDYLLITLGIANLQTAPLNHLLPHGIKSLAFVVNTRGANAPENGFETQVRVQIPEFLPQKAAYDLVKEVYLWFGYEESKVPYVKRHDNTAIIDETQIQSL